MVSTKYEDIKIGDILESIDGPVNRQAINRYAETSGDRNPIHTTYSAAVAAGLGDVIQHGLFSMAWLTKALTNWISGKGKLKRIDVQFRSMVRPNDMIHSKGKIVKKFQEAGKKLVDLELVQEAWSLLCKGIAQVTDKSINTETLQKLLQNNKLEMEIGAEIVNGEVQTINKAKFELKAEGITILPNSLTFWEYFTKGWCRKGDKIQVKFPTPLEKGKAEFEIYKVSNSIEGTATILFY